MSISERIEGSVENWRIKWGKALHDFLVAILSFGIETLLDVVGKAASGRLKPVIDKLEADGLIPDFLMPIFQEIKEPTGEVGAMFAQSAGGALMGAAIGKVSDFVLRPITHALSMKPDGILYDVAQSIAIHFRGGWSEEEYIGNLAKLGYHYGKAPWLLDLAKPRLDPGSIMTVSRRHPALADELKKDLKDMGWSDYRIHAIDLATQAFPALADVITFYAREAFEPDMIARYGLLSELPPYEGTLFEKIGVPKEIADLYWISHWVHASWTQVTEMLHRGQITEEEVYEYYRVVEIPPYWRDKLTAISWNVPTRVDVRRFWDMRTISEERMREIYQHLGYHGNDLEDYIKWTKVYTDFPMMIARFTKGWITQDEVYNWLITQGIPEERAQHFIEEKIKPEQPERVVKERDLTKAEIVKGVKKGYISVEEGIEMLMDLGYSRAEAEFKIAIDVGALEGSPETYMEFKRITELYKQSQGKEARIPSDALVQAEIDCRASQKALDAARSEEATPEKIAELEEAVETAKIAYHQLLTEYTEK